MTCLTMQLGGAATTHHWVATGVRRVARGGRNAVALAAGLGIGAPVAKAFVWPDGGWFRMVMALPVVIATVTTAEAVRRALSARNAVRASAWAILGCIVPATVTLAFDGLIGAAFGAAAGTAAAVVVLPLVSYTYAKGEPERASRGDVRRRLVVAACWLSCIGVLLYALGSKKETYPFELAPLGLAAIYFSVAMWRRVWR